MNKHGNQRGNFMKSPMGAKMKIVISEQDIKRAISNWAWDMHGIEIEVEDIEVYSNDEDEYEAEVKLGLDDEVIS